MTESVIAYVGFREVLLVQVGSKHLLFCQQVIVDVTGGNTA
jgi:hypothetical protein